jgi:hypothetical protein
LEIKNRKENDNIKTPNVIHKLQGERPYRLSLQQGKTRSTSRKNWISWMKQENMLPTPRHLLNEPQQPNITRRSDKDIFFLENWSFAVLT